MSCEYCGYQVKTGKCEKHPTAAMLTDCEACSACVFQQPLKINVDMLNAANIEVFEELQKRGQVVMGHASN